MMVDSNKLDFNGTTSHYNPAVGQSFFTGNALTSATNSNSISFMANTLNTLTN